MRIFVKKRKTNNELCPTLYCSTNMGSAAQGFYEMGFEIIEYFSLEEIYDYFKREDIVIDGIHQINKCLSKWGATPPNIDYPKVLEKYLGRKIWTDTINSINSNPDLWPVFVKPVQEKRFTGKVISKPADLIGCGYWNDNYEVLCSEVVDFIAEFRAFVKYDTIIDVRRYSGDWHINYNPKVLDEVMKDFETWEERPNGCSLDFGVTRDGKTLLIEMNCGYALGSYGLHHIDYAKLISASISQLTNTPDECLFK